MKLFLITAVAAVILFCSINPCSADHQKEELLFSDIPMVFSASKKKQFVTDSPSAVSVLTSEEISSSGATTIPDLLRLLPGVDVMTISASDLNVNVRGFNKEMSHKLLVLIDGRSVYLDFAGVVLWESLPVTIEEIDRIEVVKGPGSAVWGANAYSGVINIITRDPRHTEGSTLSLSGGDYSTYIGSFLHSGRAGDLYYRFSAGRKETNNLDENNWGQTVERDEDDNAVRATKGNFVAAKDLRNNSTLRFSGGGVEGKGEILSAMELYKREDTNSYLKMDYESDRLNFYAYWNGLRSNIDGELTGDDYNINTNTFDIELRTVYDEHPINSITAGVNYRHNQLDSNLYQGTHNQNLWGLYLQDDLKPIDGVTLSMGVREDIHPLVGNNLSPRIVLLYSPLRRHTYRLSYTTAYSLPTFNQSYLYYESPYGILFKGNRDVDPEKIRSCEAGYVGQLSDAVRISADLFYNELEDFITLLPVSSTEYTFVNSGDYRSSGGEVEISLYIITDLIVRLNYSYQYIWNEEADVRVKYSPLSKANAEVAYVPLSGFNASLAVHYVGGTYWSSSASAENWEYPFSQTSRVGADADLSPYTLVNTRVGYRISENMETYLAVNNLFNDVHREFIAGDEIGRSVTANLTLKF